MSAPSNGNAMTPHVHGSAGAAPMAVIPPERNPTAGAASVKGRLNST